MEGAETGPNAEPSIGSGDEVEAEHQERTAIPQHRSGLALRRSILKNWFAGITTCISIRRIFLKILRQRLTVFSNDLRPICAVIFHSYISGRAIQFRIAIARRFRALNQS
jgi:hypothetical protein